MREAAAGGRVEKRARRKRADWISEVQRWRASGQGAEGYAAAHGLHPRTLVWWASQLERKGVGQVPGKAGPKFVPATLAPSPSRAVSRPEPEPGPDRHEVEVVLRNGRRVRVGCEFQLEALARLLDAVEAGVAC